MQLALPLQTTLTVSCVELVLFQELREDEVGNHADKRSKVNMR